MRPMADLTEGSALLRALAHEVRLQMLSRLWQGPASVADLARHVGIPHGLASQHVKTLREAGLVRQVGSETRRGGHATLYAATGGAPLTSLASGDTDVTPLVATMAALMNTRSRRRTPGRPALLADAELWVSTSAWEKFQAQMLDTIVELHHAVQDAETPGSVQIGLSVLGVQLRPSSDQTRRSHHDEE
jgi:DNA-binding transcriptional ArsR family regulator